MKRERDFRVKVFYLPSNISPTYFSRIGNIRNIYIYERERKRETRRETFLQGNLHVSQKIGSTDRAELPRPFGNTNDTNERETRETGTRDGDCFQPVVSYRDARFSRSLEYLPRSVIKSSIKTSDCPPCDFLQRIRER